MVIIWQVFKKFHDVKGTCLQGSWSTALRIQHICSLGIKTVLSLREFSLSLFWLGSVPGLSLVETFVMFWRTLFPCTDAHCRSSAICFGDKQPLPGFGSFGNSENWISGRSFFSYASWTTLKQPLNLCFSRFKNISVKLKKIADSVFNTTQFQQWSWSATCKRKALPHGKQCGNKWNCVRVNSALNEYYF